MSTQQLVATAKAMVAPGKGILAIDESNNTCNKRFEKLGIAPTEENRRTYRELLLTTPGLGNYINGAILYDETIRQTTKDGTPFVKVMNDAGILVGIKVDTGVKGLPNHPDEKITQGLDDLSNRIAEYVKIGARFAKWRAVLTIGKEIPSRDCIEANAQALARYALLCQQGGLVPIVEPEVLMDGDHTIKRCYFVTKEVLGTVFDQLHLQGVVLEQMILKPNMVISGKDCKEQASVPEVAEATVKCLLNVVPTAVQGVAFLSGGQNNELATAHLNEMHVRFGSKLPWPLTFSFGRAIQQPALELWKVQDANVKAAQSALLHRAKCNAAASLGIYTQEMERSIELALAGYRALRSQLSSQD
ncbi:fructose-bisphosphate aldolase class I (plasmid) [Nostoc sp. C052]|uniref:class I fructose-bisphosphate aldolase n=1 Tax=Nostoc sp. C052 TaxID=2576902 RepID=UPI0015C2EE51|nr:class I fructose-bisphosphate aldolase [Nostoc sp. C052]QLE45356.1 fructose-bisphosphate aldolase class I [Nostoc sp. C052]